METIKVPHAEISYEETRPISAFKGFDWSKATKTDAVMFARATGFKETGMSVNEIALLFDLLEKKGACNIVELGRNFGTSTRLFIQHVIRHGGRLESWDLKHWPGFLETMSENGYIFEGRAFGPDLYDEGARFDFGPLETLDQTRHNVHLRIADSVKTPITQEERFVDFLLIDTEHGLEHALGEYMRWRNYIKSSGMVAFHDSTLPGPSRAIEIIKEVEEKGYGDRFVREYVNERVDGYGIQVLEWRG